MPYALVGEPHGRRMAAEDASHGLLHGRWLGAAVRWAARVRRKGSLGPVWRRMPGGRGEFAKLTPRPPPSSRPKGAGALWSLAPRWVVPGIGKAPSRGARQDPVLRVAPGDHLPGRQPARHVLAALGVPSPEADGRWFGDHVPSFTVGAVDVDVELASESPPVAVGIEPEAVGIVVPEEAPAAIASEQPRDIPLSVERGLARWVPYWCGGRVLAERPVWHGRTPWVVWWAPGGSPSPERVITTQASSVWAERGLWRTRSWQGGPAADLMGRGRVPARPVAAGATAWSTTGSGQNWSWVVPVGSRLWPPTGSG